MTIGELFINLGIKGTEKTVGALTTVKKGLGEVSSMSLEAKAGIFALLYGLERLTAMSGATGTSMANFTALTDISGQTLQKWQYAARQAGESSDDLASSMKSVQNSMSQMLLGKGAPEGLGLIAKTVKDFDPSRIRDTVYVMGKLVEAAQKLPKDIGQTAIRSFGVSDAFISAARRGVFTEENFAKAPTYKEGELKQLDKANIAWSNLGNKVEMAIGHLNAKHGVELVTDLTKIADQVFRLAEGLDRVASKLKIFQGVAWVFKQLAGAVEDVNQWQEGKRDFWGRPLDKSGNATGEQTLMGTIFGQSATDRDFMSWWKKPIHGSQSLDIYDQVSKTKPVWDKSYYPSAVSPSLSPSRKSDSVQNVDVNQTVIFQGHHDAPKKTVDTLHKATGDYIKQSPVKNQGS